VLVIEPKNYNYLFLLYLSTELLRPHECGQIVNASPAEREASGSTYKRQVLFTPGDYEMFFSFDIGRSSFKTTRYGKNVTRGCL
jgi:hypothetical protein